MHRVSSCCTMFPNKRLTLTLPVSFRFESRDDSLALASRLSESITQGAGC
jgi:hypothetical protein